MARRDQKFTDREIAEQLRDPFIYRFISFSILKGDGLMSVRSKTRRGLIDLESHCQRLIDQYRDRKLEGLQLERRVYETYSELKWRLTIGTKRMYVSRDDERLGDYLANLPEVEQEWLSEFLDEIEVANANLRIEWTVYNEALRIGQCDAQEFVVTPKSILSLCSEPLQKLAL